MQFSLREMFQHCAEYGLDGHRLDLVIQSGGGNVISEKNPVLAVPMISAKHLFLMLNKSSFPHIYIARGIFHINALFSFTNTFPAARIYFLKTDNLIQLERWSSELANYGLDFLTLPIIDDSEFEHRIGAKDYFFRFSEWRQKREVEYKTFGELAKGRSKNTSVENAIWLNSTHCFFCKNPAPVMHTFSKSNSKLGVMLGVRVCEEHHEEINSNNGLQATLEKRFNLSRNEVAIVQAEANFESMLELNCQFIREKLSCVILGITNNEIVADRPSGIRVIFRLTGIDNYAYNIDYPNKEKHSRIDSKDHHPVHFGPDHIHRKLTRKQKNKVESSFTYGQPFLDFKIILELIEDAEAQWKSKSNT